MRQMSSLTIIIPTYNEKENIRTLAERISVALRGVLEYEIIFVDDDSPDGTAQEVAGLPAEYCCKVITRKGQRGLASAVVEGINSACYPVVLVMDADLSHPPEVIPDLYQALSDNVDIVVGSRYVAGGTTDKKWTIWRRLNSWIATIMVTPLVHIKDPLSGFFIFRKNLLDKARPLKPIGYKILLEIIEKTNARNVREIPINFKTRTKGRCKFSFKEQLLFIWHVLNLYVDKIIKA
jgi:dolichol-phosphate mannosyltransferase